jgi:hypothetical protein
METVGRRIVFRSAKDVVNKTHLNVVGLTPHSNGCATALMV